MSKSRRPKSIILRYREFVMCPFMSQSWGSTKNETQDVSVVLRVERKKPWRITLMKRKKRFMKKI